MKQIRLKLSIVIPVLNQVKLAKACYATMLKNMDRNSMYEIFVIDNGSSEPLKKEDFPEADIIRNEHNIGVYPTFKQGMDASFGDVVAFFHSDLVVWGRGWNSTVLAAFELKEKMGLMGFVGSDEIDAMGGRGGGTISNFQGLKLLGDGQVWKGSHAREHSPGVTITDYHRAAVVDGCAMILRRKAWEDIGNRSDWPPHHFYDRLISCQMLEHQWSVCVQGIACDHISGQTANSDKTYFETAEHWCTERGIPMKTAWDHTLYLEAERMFLSEYRDTKRIIPIKICS